MLFTEKQNLLKSEVIKQLQRTKKKEFDVLEILDCGELKNLDILMKNYSLKIDLNHNHGGI